MCTRGLIAEEVRRAAERKLDDTLIEIDSVDCTLAEANAVASSPLPYRESRVVWHDTARGRLIQERSKEVIILSIHDGDAQTTSAPCQLRRGRQPPNPAPRITTCGPDELGIRVLRLFLASR